MRVSTSRIKGGVRDRRNGLMVTAMKETGYKGRCKEKVLKCGETETRIQASGTMIRCMEWE